MKPSLKTALKIQDPSPNIPKSLNWCLIYFSHQNTPTEKKKKKLFIFYLLNLALADVDLQKPAGEN